MNFLIAQLVTKFLSLHFALPANPLWLKFTFMRIYLAKHRILYKQRMPLRSDTL